MLEAPCDTQLPPFMQNVSSVLHHVVSHTPRDPSVKPSWQVHEKPENRPTSAFNESVHTIAQRTADADMTLDRPFSAIARWCASFLQIIEYRTKPESKVLC